MIRRQAILLDPVPGDGGGLATDEFQRKVLGGVDKLTADLKGKAGTDDLQAAIKRLEALEKSNDLPALKTAVAEVQTKLVEFQKRQIVGRTLSTPVPGRVSDECARYLGGVLIAAGLRTGRMSGDRYEGIAKDIFGAEFKTALSASDIPLPTGYAGEVVELVSQYGTARRYGTVFPLGNGVVNLPRLKTDTTFTLLAQATAITEKSPQTEWVTFTAEKFGGLIRLPSEIDEDSLFAMGQFIARYSARNIARSEDHNFWVGTGAASGVNGTAEGFTKNVVTNSKTTVTGTLGSPAEMTLTHLRRARAVVDAPAIGMGAYYMHPTFEQHLSTLNTAGDKPYIANGINGASLDGFPIRWIDVMPVFNTADVVSTVHVLFGDASYQYLGVRGGISFATSTDAGFETDEILIRALERFTVGLMAKGAMAGVITHSA